MTQSRHALPQPAPHHHLTDDLVFRYAAGMLDEAISLVIASHLTFCTACQALMAEAELLGGQLLEDLPATDVDATTWQKTLARLETNPASREDLRIRSQQPKTPSSSDRAMASSLENLWPTPLRPYLTAPLDRLPWRRLGPGMRDLELIRNKSGSTARLLYFGAGKSVFEHGHRGNELTLVLQGSYVSNGNWFVRGDIECSDQETLHRPVAGTEADCICLAVIDAPLRFSSIIGRLLQPLIGI
jgi:putative transcriptional regulator